jgi:hypothetical protein
MNGHIKTVLDDTLAYSRASDYQGWNKHDGLNSPLLGPLLGWSKFTRLLGIQFIMRAPVNLRPFFKVPKTRNPKGIGLFAHALLDLHAVTGETRYLEEANRLLDWLLEHPAQGFRGLSWGYPYPWQDVGFFAPRDYPNRVVTCWIGFALAEALRRTGKEQYRDALPRIAEFLLQEPNCLCDDADMLCYTYVPDARVHWAVMDVSALMGALLAETGELLSEQRYQSVATRLVNWVVDKQTDYGAWYYTHPPGDSHIRHDNYHTGIILDCIDRYRDATHDSRFDDTWKQGLAYYREHLFTVDGAPRWMNDREYPYDIHGAAAGMLCFYRAAMRDPSYRPFAEKILHWTLDNMYDERGFFYYQKTRLLTKRFCLLRWCNAWMCRAMAYVLRVQQAR